MALLFQDALYVTNVLFFIPKFTTIIKVNIYIGVQKKLINQQDLTKIDMKSSLNN